MMDRKLMPLEHELFFDMYDEATEILKNYPN